MAGPIAGMLIDYLEVKLFKIYSKNNSDPKISKRQSSATACGVSLILTSILGMLLTAMAISEQVAAVFVISGTDMTHSL